MTASVLLLRGINVGGHGRLPMADLRAAIEAAGGMHPLTYIQSGNAVFRGEVGEEALGREIEARAGFIPATLLFGADEFRDILAANPFARLTDDEKALHVHFLKSPAAAAEADLAAAADPEERLCLTRNALYHYTPRQLSGSAVAPRLDRMLGVASTSRNWKTVTAISALLDKLP